MEFSKDNFSLLMKSIRRFFNILDLSKAVEDMKKGRLPQRSLAVTFDDGYLDNYEFAKDILEKNNIPATFFVPVNQIEEGLPYWWDKLYFYIIEYRKDFYRWVVNLRKNRKIFFKLEDELFYKNKNIYARSIVRELNLLDNGKRNFFLDEMEKEFGDYLGKRLVMNWNEIADLSDRGFSIGSHTLSHVPLEDVDLKIAEKEIFESKRILENKINKNVNGFCYPRGSWNRDISNIVNKSGYLYAVTTEFGSNDAKSSYYYGLKRRNMSDYSGIRSFLPIPMYLIEISGFFDKILSGRR